MSAAIRAVRRTGSGRIVVAVPVGSAEAVEKVCQEADAVVCPLVPAPFRAVGAYYEDFSQVTDDEVCRALDQAKSFGTS